MLRFLACIIALLLLCGCKTTATRDGDTLTIDSAGKATWEDGVSIERTPLFKWPSFSPKIIP